MRRLQSTDKVFAIDPSDIKALNNKANALKNLQKYDEAIVYYDKVLSIDPSAVYALNGKAFALANLDKNEEALPIIQKVLKSDSNKEN